MLGRSFLKQFPTYRECSTPANLSLFLVVLLVSYLSTFFLWREPILAALPIVAAGIVGLLTLRSYKVLALYLLFALVGAGHEALFITQGLWEYHAESFFEIPFYLPFVWGNIALLAATCLKAILILDRGQRLYHQPPRFFVSAGSTLLLAALAFLSIYFLNDRPGALIGALLLLDILYLLVMRSVPLALTGLMAFSSGAVADLVAVPLGIWTYPSLDWSVFGIPLYIFVGWDVMGLLMAGFYLTLDAPDSPLNRRGVTSSPMAPGGRS